MPDATLGVQPFAVSDVAYDTSRYDIGAVRSGYAANPSRLAALAYLELALVEKKRARRGVYADMIQRAVAKLDLENMDYRKDIDFRLSLHESMNFARRETCLLYLAAEEARRAGRPRAAERYYSILIERAPGSPFAWEALAAMSALPGVDSAKVGASKGTLLETYPLLWGCPRQNLKLGREDFAKQMPMVLRKVATSQNGPANPRN